MSVPLKKKRFSIRDQMRLMRKGRQATDTEEKKTDDPIRSCDSNWFKKAKSAYEWKAKWESMQALMEFATADAFGNQPMPKKFRPNKKAGDVMSLFAKWLNDDNGHIFTRKHIMRLLVPFSKSYDKSYWKTSGSMAKGLMTKQWMEKAPNFLPLVTPAIIAVYEGSCAKLISWISDLEAAANSEQPQIRMSVWDFLGKICIVGDLSDFNISSSKTSGDIKDILHNGSMMKALERALLEDNDKATRDSAAMFIYGAKNLTRNTGRLKYNDIRENKRARMALDIASDNYHRATRMLKGQKAPTNEDIAKKQERRQAKSTAKKQTKRKNNMRAAIMAAKRKTKHQGGCGEIQIAAIRSAKDSDKQRHRKEHKRKKEKQRERSDDSDTEKERRERRKKKKRTDSYDSERRRRMKEQRLAVLTERETRKKEKARKKKEKAAKREQKKIDEERERMRKCQDKEDILQKQQKHDAFEEQKIFYEKQNEINIDQIMYKNQKLMEENKRLKVVNNALKQQVAHMAEDEKKAQSEDKCNVKFAEWLCNTVKMGQYLTSFEQNEYNDIRMVEFLDRDTLQNDVGIKKQLHCKLILKKVNEFKLLQKEFNALLCDNKQLNQHKQQLEEYAILTLNDLQNDIKSIQELGNMINVEDKNKLNHLWTVIHSDHDRNIINISSHKEKEGQMTEYH